MIIYIFINNIMRLLNMIPLAKKDWTNKNTDDLSKKDVNNVNEIQSILNIYDEAYIDFNLRYSTNQEQRKEIMNAISEEMALGNSDTEILKKYIWM